jgi:ribosomal protein S18 acetylase RimI-like enzyme
MAAIMLDQDPHVDIRPATPDDAFVMAELIEIAGERIPSYLWSTMAEPDETPLDVGARRAKRESGSFSYTNALIAAIDDDPVGMLLGYPLEPPSASDIAELKDIPALFRPFVELEHLAPGSFYINALAVFPTHRDRGLGSQLLDAGAARARQLGCHYLSVQAFSQNPRAIGLYQRHGYSVVDERPVIAHPCYPYNDRTLLLTRNTDL